MGFYKIETCCSADVLNRCQLKLNIVESFLNRNDDKELISEAPKVFLKPSSLIVKSEPSESRTRALTTSNFDWNSGNLINETATENTDQLNTVDTFKVHSPKKTDRNVSSAYVDLKDEESIGKFVPVVSKAQTVTASNSDLTNDIAAANSGSDLEEEEEMDIKSSNVHTSSPANQHDLGYNVGSFSKVNLNDETIRNTMSESIGLTPLPQNSPSIDMNFESAWESRRDDVKRDDMDVAHEPKVPESFVQSIQEELSRHGKFELETVTQQLAQITEKYKSHLSQTVQNALEICSSLEDRARRLEEQITMLNKGTHIISRTLEELERKENDKMETFMSHLSELTQNVNADLHQKAQNICASLENRMVGNFDDHLKTLKKGTEKVANHLKDLDQKGDRITESVKSKLEQYNAESDECVQNMRQLYKSLEDRTAQFNDRMSSLREESQNISGQLDDTKNKLETVFDQIKHEYLQFKERMAAKTETETQNFLQLRDERDKDSREIKEVKKKLRTCEKETLNVQDKLNEVLDALNKIKIGQQSNDAAISKLKTLNLDESIKDNDVQINLANSIQEINSQLSGDRYSLKDISERQSYQEEKMQWLENESKTQRQDIITRLKGLEQTQSEQENYVRDEIRQLQQPTGRDELTAMINENSHKIAKVSKLYENLDKTWQSNLQCLIEIMTNRLDDKLLISTLHNVDDILVKLSKTICKASSVNELLTCQLKGGNIGESQLNDLRDFLKQASKVCATRHSEMNKLWTNISECQLGALKEILQTNIHEQFKEMKDMLQAKLSPRRDLEQFSDESNKSLKTKLYFNVVPKNESLLDGVLEYQMEPSMEPCRENDLSEFLRYWNTSWAPCTKLFVKDAYSKLCSLAQKVITNYSEFVSYLHTMNASRIFDRRVLVCQVFNRRMFIFKTGPRYVYPYFRLVDIPDKKSISQVDICNGVIFFRLCVRCESSRNIVNDSQLRSNYLDSNGSITLWISDEFHYMTSGGDLVFPQCAIYPDMNRFFYPYERPHYYGYFEGEPDTVFDLTEFFFEKLAPINPFQGYNMGQIHVVRDIDRTDWFANRTLVRDKIYEPWNEKEEEPLYFTGYAEALKANRDAKESEQMAQGTLRIHIKSLLSALCLRVNTFNTSVAMRIDSKEDEKHIKSIVDSLIQCVLLISESQSRSVLKNGILKYLDALGTTGLKDSIQNAVIQRLLE